MKISDEILFEIGKNIVDWYEFKPSSNILTINCENNIIEKLKEKKCNVINIFDINNYSDNFKFDYIFIYGIKENQILEELLSFAKNNINDSGVILFTCNNKFAIENCNFKNNKIDYEKKYTKKTIENILKNLKMEHYKFYYPLPNYKIPNIIFSDNYLPDQEEISRDLTLYDEENIIMFDERETFNCIINEDRDMFRFFANSYFVEISNKENLTRFVSFNNYRKDRYKITTIMKNEYVNKYASNIRSMSHIENIKDNIKILDKLGFNLIDYEKDGIIYSKIMDKEKKLGNIIIENMLKNNYDIVYNIIENFNNELKSKLPKAISLDNTVFEKYKICVDKNIKEKLNFIKDGFYDLIFQNCFFENNKYYFFDQEWKEMNIPIEFIYYREIIYLCNICNKFDKKELFKTFNIEEYIQIFEDLEDKIQEEIKNKQIWDIHKLNYKNIKNLYDTLEYYTGLYNVEKEKCRLYEEQLKQSNEYINGLKNENEKLKEKLEKKN